jgi:hypothetical protein
MSTVLKYGTYSHSPDEVMLDNIGRTLEFNDSGVLNSAKLRWDFSGKLKASSQSALGTAILAMESAYAVVGSDLIFTLDGTTQSAHAVLGTNCLYGPRCIELSFGNEIQSEYATMRSYKISMEAVLEYNASSSSSTSTVTSFDESISVEGGGKRRIMAEYIVELPRSFIVAQKTVARATQEGSATGRNGYPSIPSPLWPSNEMEDRRQISKKSPKLQDGNTARSFEVTWRYEYEFSERPTLTVPNRWL